MLPAVYPVSFVTGASHSEAVDFNEMYERLNFHIDSTSGTFGANDPIYMESSVDGITYHRFVAAESQTAVIGVNDFRIKSGLSHRVIPMPVVGSRYMRLRLASGTTASSSLVFHLVGLKTR